MGSLASLVEFVILRSLTMLALALVVLPCFADEPARQSLYANKTIIYDIRLEEVKHGSGFLESCQRLLENSRGYLYERVRESELTKQPPQYGMGDQGPSYLIARQNSLEMKLIFLDRERASSDARVYSQTVIYDKLSNASSLAGAQSCLSFVQEQFQQGVWPSYSQTDAPVIVERTLEEAVTTAMEIDAEHERVLRNFYQESYEAEFSTFTWFLRGTHVENQVVFLHRLNDATLVSALPPYDSFGPIPTIKIVDDRDPTTGSTVSLLQAVKNLQDKKRVEFELDLKCKGLACEQEEELDLWKSSVEGALWLGEDKISTLDVSFVRQDPAGDLYEEEKIILGAIVPFHQILAKHALIEMKVDQSGFEFLSPPIPTQATSSFSWENNHGFRTRIQYLKGEAGRIVVSSPVVRASKCDFYNVTRELGNSTFSFNSLEARVPVALDPEVIFNHLRRVAATRDLPLWRQELEAREYFEGRSPEKSFGLSRKEVVSLNKANGCLQELWDQLFRFMFRLDRSSKQMMQAREAPWLSAKSSDERITFEILVQAPRYDSLDHEVRKKFGSEAKSRKRAAYVHSFIKSQIARKKEDFDIRVRVIEGALLDEHLNAGYGDLIVSVLTW